MDWFKHPADFASDQTITPIINEMGMSGYGAYWLITEFIARNSKRNETPVFNLSLRSLRRITGLSVKKLMKFIDLCNQSNALLILIKGDEAAVSAPSVLKHRWLTERWKVLDISINDWLQIRISVLERDNYTCRYCGENKPEFIECDHVIPLSRGGLSTDDNLVAACRTCNRSKSDKLLSEWKPGMVL